MNPMKSALVTLADYYLFTYRSSWLEAWVLNELLLEMSDE